LALGIGLQLAKTRGSVLQVLHAGEPSNPALQDYLALGAVHIDVIETEINKVENLANHLKDYELILTGSRAEHAETNTCKNTGLLPYLLAEKLNLPIIANALSIKLIENSIEVLQFLPKGKRRLVQVPLPAVVSIHPLASTVKHFAFANQVAGNIRTVAPLPVTNKHNEDNLHWQALPIKRKPITLKARSNKTGHERLLEAITAESKGGAVVIEGNSVDKAQVILSYLREHRLVNF
jgi:electron transfer flavoprotein beta subunit